MAIDLVLGASYYDQACATPPLRLGGPESMLRRAG